MTATADITVNKVENVLVMPNAALRFTPPARKMRTSGRGLLSALLPRRPWRRPEKERGNSGNPNQQRVWTLQGGQPVPITVTIGATDGTMTEVIGGDIGPGTVLVVDTVSAGR
jgi:HlyD family secretion protein